MVYKWNRNYEKIECKTCHKIKEMPKWRHAKFCCNKCANVRPNSSRFEKGYEESNEIKIKRGNALKGKIAGRKHWNYIDGRSKLVSPRRYGDDWEAVRRLIYLRDNFTCQECGITSKENKRALDVHHKIPFLISFDNSISNLITLCASCHKKIEAQLIKQIKEKNMIGEIK